MSRKIGINPFPNALHFDNAGVILGKRCIITTKPFKRISSHGVEILPSGFICDGASIPGLAQAIIGHPFDCYLEDAVWHDWDYSPNGTKARALADRLFRETMWNRQIPLWKLSSMYAAVRMAGGKHFKGSPYP